MPGRPFCVIAGDEVNDAGRDDDTDGKDYVADYVDVSGLDVYVLKYFGVTVGVGTTGVAVTVVVVIVMVVAMVMMVMVVMIVLMTRCFIF